MYQLSWLDVVLVVALIVSWYLYHRERSLRRTEFKNLPANEKAKVFLETLDDMAYEVGK